MDKCPYIKCPCVECLCECKRTGHICELEIGDYCEIWDDEKKEERE